VAKKVGGGAKRQALVKILHIEFEDNLSNALGADTWSQKDWRK
jgi:hypothetical protein